MVTDIVKNEDIHPDFMNINDWIIDGITIYAILACRNEWCKNDIKKFIPVNCIRNLTDHSYKHINPITKW